MSVIWSAVLYILFTPIIINKLKHQIGSGCRQLSNPANGRVTISNRTVGGVATYFCNSGFNLVGAKTRVCQSGGEWSGIAPSCQGKKGVISVILSVLLL